jgi:hypothetical protein
MQAGILGMIQAIAFFEVGELTGHQPGFGTSKYYENVLGHAAVGCVATAIGGGKCGAGALAAAVPAFAGPFVNKLPFQAALMANSTLGGLASVAGGGKFANGAVTAAFGYLFNAAAGRLIGGQIAAWAVGLAAWELGPFEIPLIIGARWAGGAIGSYIEDKLFNSSADDSSDKESGGVRPVPGTRPGDLPARDQEPDSTQVKDSGGGKGQIREYGPDGKAVKDFDFGHDHGSGDPHAHDWDWSQPRPRGPGRPIEPNE